MSKDKQDQSSENKPDFVSEQPGTTAKFVENRPTPISQESAGLRNYPILVSLLQSPTKRNIETSLQGQHSSSEITSSSKKRASFIHPSQSTRTLFVPSEASFASIKQETAIGEKPRIRTRSSSAETTTASREHAGATCPSMDLTPLNTNQTKSREQVAAECSRNRTMSRPTPAEPTSEEVFEYIWNRHYIDILPFMYSTDSSDTEYESPETSEKTSEQQSSASAHESFLKNPAQPSEAPQDTEIEKDDDRLEERLGLFDKLICVKCLAEFTTRDQLLQHEPIHFND